MRLPKFLPKQKRPKLFIVRRVAGSSMLPTLVPGRVVVGVRCRTYRLGDIIIVRHDGMEKIKRIANIKGGLLYIHGDNAASSTDSRHFGWLPRKEILAKVIWP